MHDKIAFWLLVGFLSLCAVAMVVELIGHARDRKHEKEMTNFFTGLLERIFKSRPLEDEVSHKPHKKVDRRPS